MAENPCQGPCWTSDDKLCGGGDHPGGVTDDRVGDKEKAGLLIPEHYYSLRTMIDATSSS